MTDWSTFFDETRAELEGSERSNEDFLEELRGLIRNSRLSLPMYRRVQEPRRYAMTVEDLEILEDTYKQLANNEEGLFEREDYIDAVVQARGTFTVIMDVMADGMGPGARQDLAEARQVERRGCAVALLFGSLAIWGVSTLLMAFI